MQALEQSKANQLLFLPERRKSVFMFPNKEVDYLYSQIEKKYFENIIFNFFLMEIN